MSSLLAALMVLSALITKGDSLVCETCHVEDAQSCSGIHETCADHITHCVKGMEINTVRGTVQTFAYKGCVSVDKLVACDRNIIHRNNQLSVQMKRECCTEDLCNTGDVHVPPIDLTLNGLKCPGCVTVESRHGCTDSDVVLCTGNENLCASFNGIITKKGDIPRDYTHTGCNNRDACEAGVPGLESPYVTDTKQECSNAIEV